MTATIDGLTRERLLEFANASTGGDRETLLELAGKWKHNWVPLDAIAAAIKAKRMKGDGVRRSSTDDTVVRTAGKTRFDPKGAAAHSALTTGTRGKARPPARAAVTEAKARAGRASQHAAALTGSHDGSSTQLRAAARAHEAADAAHTTAGNPATAEKHRAEAGRLHAEASRPDPMIPGAQTDAAKAINAQAAGHDARHAQIAKEIKVRKLTEGGNVSFLAEHSNGVNTVSARIPQQRGKTDHQHRLAAREALAKGIRRDHPDRAPAGGQPKVGENAPSVRGSTQADRDKALRAQREAQTAAAISSLAGRDMADLRRLAESKAVKPKVRAAALAELRKRETPEQTAQRIGMEFVKPTVKGHAVIGEGTVEAQDREKAISDAQSMGAGIQRPKRDLKETHPVGMQVDARQPGIDRVTPGIVTAHKPDGMLEVGYKDHRGNIARGTFNPAHVTPSHRAETVDVGTAGASSPVGHARPNGNGLDVTVTSGGTTYRRSGGGLFYTVPEKGAGQPVTNKALNGRLEAAHQKAVQEHYAKQAGPGKAEAAAESAAPAKKPRKPSALHQEYRTRREEQDRRFEAHTGGGVAAADTHTQEYKDYFGVGDHSTSPQEQRLTFKSFLEERRQGAEYERRQQQAYDSGAQLGAKHGEAEGDTSGHEAEYRHASTGHDEEMFGQGYSDGVIAGAARADKRQKDNARKMAELEYGRARDAAHATTAAAVTESGHRAAVHAHVAAGRASLAAGRRQEAQQHIAKAEEHKGHADRLAAELAQAKARLGEEASPPTGETRQVGQAASLDAKRAARAEETPRQIHERLQRDPSKVSNEELKRLDRLGGKFAPAARAEQSRRNAEIARKNAAAGHTGFPGGTIPGTWAHVYAQRAQKAAEAESSPKIRVEHSGDGTLVHGTERGDTETTSALKAQGFKWSRNLNAWYLPRTWGESTREIRVRGLQARLGDKVTVQRGEAARSGTAAERAQAATDRAKEIADQQRARAERFRAESDAQDAAARRISDNIPFGQPVLVGHHSERRHRRDLERIQSSTRKSHESYQAAQAAESRARSAEARASMQTDPRAAARRLDRSEAELRAVERKLNGTGKEIHGENHPATGEYADRLKARQQELRQQIEHDRGIAGDRVGPEARYGKHNITPGDVVKIGGSAHVVHSTGPKNAKLMTEVGPLPYAYSQIQSVGKLDAVSTEALKKLLARNAELNRFGAGNSRRLPPAVIDRIEAILRDRGEI